MLCGGRDFVSLSRTPGAVTESRTRADSLDKKRKHFSRYFLGCQRYRLSEAFQARGAQKEKKKIVERWNK